MPFHFEEEMQITFAQIDPFLLQYTALAFQIVHFYHLEHWISKEKTIADPRVFANFPSKEPVVTSAKELVLVGC